MYVLLFQANGERAESFPCIPSSQLPLAQINYAKILCHILGWQIPLPFVYLSSKNYLLEGSWRVPIIQVEHPGLRTTVTLVALSFQQQESRTVSSELGHWLTHLQTTFCPGCWSAQSTVFSNPTKIAWTGAEPDSRYKWVWGSSVNIKSG